MGLAAVNPDLHKTSQSLLEFWEFLSSKNKELTTALNALFKFLKAKDDEHQDEIMKQEDERLSVILKEIQENGVAYQAALQEAQQHQLSEPSQEQSSHTNHLLLRNPDFVRALTEFASDYAALHHEFVSRHRGGDFHAYLREVAVPDGLPNDVAAPASAPVSVPGTTKSEYAALHHEFVAPHRGGDFHADLREVAVPDGLPNDVAALPSAPVPVPGTTKKVKEHPEFENRAKDLLAKYIRLQLLGQDILATHTIGMSFRRPSTYDVQVNTPIAVTPINDVLRFLADLHKTGMDLLVKAGASH